jgi:hypothetical protein
LLEIGLESRLAVKGLACYAPLQVVEMGRFQGIQLGKVELGKDDVLPVDSSLQFKEGLPN